MPETGSSPAGGWVGGRSELAVGGARCRRVVTVAVDDDKVVAKVAEERAKEAVRVGHDEAAARRAARLVDARRLGERGAGDDDDPERADELRGELAGVLVDGYIPVARGAAAQISGS